MSLNTLSDADLGALISGLEARVLELERMLQGQSITTARIADAAITTAKIVSLEADKITAGDLTVQVDIGDAATGFTRLDGVNNRIINHDGTNNRIVIGEA